MLLRIPTLLQQLIIGLGGVGQITLPGWLIALCLVLTLPRFGLARPPAAPSATSPVSASVSVPASAAAASASSASLPTQPRRRALLIGIGSYATPGYNLAGPVNDVLALQSVLQRRWGFAPRHIQTLTTPAETTRAHILQQLSALAQKSAPGDEVLVFFSGHGTSGLDSLSRHAVPFGSGALYPSDFDFAHPALDNLLIGRFDLLPRLAAIDKKVAKLWVIADACFSGQLVRASDWPEVADLPDRLIPLKLDLAALRQQVNARLLREKVAAGAVVPGYPYQTAVFLAASAEGETAKDLPASGPDTPVSLKTLDGKAHGALTDALLRVLEGQLLADYDGDGALSLIEVQRAVAEWMHARAYGHSPQALPAVLEDRQGLALRPVLGAREVAAKPTGRPATKPNAPQSSAQSSTQSLPALGVWLPAIAPAVRQAVLGLPDVVEVPTLAQAGLWLYSNKQGQIEVRAPVGLLARFAPAELAAIRAQVYQVAWATRL